MSLAENEQFWGVKYSYAMRDLSREPNCVLTWVKCCRVVPEAVTNQNSSLPDWKLPCHRVLGSSGRCCKMLSALKKLHPWGAGVHPAVIRIPRWTSAECHGMLRFGSVLQLFLFTQGCLVPRQRLRNETPFPLRDPHCLTSQTSCSKVIFTSVSSLESVNKM